MGGECCSKVPQRKRLFPWRSQNASVSTEKASVRMEKTHFSKEKAYFYTEK